MDKTEYQTIDEYIQSFPPAVQKILTKIRQTIRQSAPGAGESISYRMPVFRLNGNLVYFAAFKHHIGFYPTASGIAAFKQELSAYQWSKGAVQFPLDQPIPYDLIKKIVVFRVQENLAKSTVKPPRPA
jgi:uncharacterized protein YdhG (YjbR/CyaY superfamily)